MSARPHRSEYQSLPNTAEEEADVGDLEENRPSSSQQPSSSNGGGGRRRTGGGVSIDLAKLDNAFKRCATVSSECPGPGPTDIQLRTSWTESIAQKVKRKKQAPQHTRKHIWRSVFEPTIPPGPTYGFVRSLQHHGRRVLTCGCRRRHSTTSPQ